MKKFYCLVFLIFATFSASGQKGKTAQADKYYKDYQFLAAAQAYERILKSDAKNVEVMEKLVYCYTKLNNPVKSEFWLGKVLKNPQSDAKSYKTFGTLLAANGKYAEATTWFDKSYEQTKDEESLRWVKTYRNLSQFYQDSALYALEKVHFNSKYSDFSPAFYKDGVVFCSARENPKVSKAKFEYNDTWFIDLYFVKDSLSRALPFSAEINSKFHEGPVSFTPNQDMVYFTRNNYLKKNLFSSDGVSKLKIYYAPVSNDHWGQIREFPLNNNEYSVGQPAMATADLMYFVSDMPGGLGGTDLYRTEKVNDAWQTPVNLGPEINTTGNEMFPFVDGQGILYFASNGHPGLGGLDVFYSAISGQTFGPVQNMGFPINTSRDDFGFIIEGNKGFFASNRKGDSNNDDIYKFTLKQNHPLLMVAQLKAKEEELALADAQLAKINGQEMAEAGLNAEQNKLLNQLEQSLKAFNKDKEVVPEPVVKKPAVSRLTKLASLPKEFKGGEVGEIIELEIQYDLDKTNIRPDAALVLDGLVAFMKRNPNVKVELGAHTDLRGSDKYNLNLSQGRAQSVVDYVTAKGIGNGRLVPVGFGETQPAIRDAQNEEEHQANRRTTARIFANESDLIAFQEEVTQPSVAALTADLKNKLEEESLNDQNARAYQAQVAKNSVAVKAAAKAEAANKANAQNQTRNNSSQPGKNPAGEVLAQNTNKTKTGAGKSGQDQLALSGDTPGIGQADPTGTKSPATTSKPGNNSGPGQANPISGGQKAGGNGAGKAEKSLAGADVIKDPDATKLTLSDEPELSEDPTQRTAQIASFSVKLREQLKEKEALIEASGGSAAEKEALKQKLKKEAEALIEEMLAGLKDPAAAKKSVAAKNTNPGADPMDGAGNQSAAAAKAKTAAGKTLAVVNPDETGTNATGRKTAAKNTAGKPGAGGEGATGLVGEVADAGNPAVAETKVARKRKAIFWNPLKNALADARTAEALANEEADQFFIISNAFVSLERAENYLEKVADLAADAKILMPLPGSRLHRVVVADYSSRMEAQAQLVHKKRIFGASSWILGVNSKAITVKYLDPNNPDPEGETLASAEISAKNALVKEEETANKAAARAARAAASSPDESAVAAEIKKNKVFTLRDIFNFSNNTSNNTSNRRAAANARLLEKVSGYAVSEASNRFYIIAGGFSTLENADKYRKKLARLTDKSKVILPYEGSKLYRIAVADFESREEAVRQLPRLKRTFGLFIWILKY